MTLLSKRNVIAMAAMFGALPQIKISSKSTREANDDLAQRFMRERFSREDRYRDMLIRTGRVRDYGHCIAINKRNADRKKV